MKDPVERSSRVTRRTAENQQTTRSGRAVNRGATSLSPYPDRTNGRKRKRAEENSSSKKSNIVENNYPADNSSANAQDPIPNIPRRTFKGMPGDAFCWTCHKSTNEYLCPDCPRVYHTKCLKKIKFHLSEPVCECKWSSVDGPHFIPNATRNLKELLELVLEKVIYEKSSKKNLGTNEYIGQLKTWPDDNGGTVLCEVVDIDFILDRISAEYYKSSGDFFLDVKWILHNCYIVKGSDHIMTTTAQKFEKAVKLQLSDMEACFECYREKYALYPSSDFFANLCVPPHSVVWAKLKGFPFWPAKCLRIVNGHADVRFFGTHDKSLVPLPQVYKISRRNPGANPKKPKNSSRMTSYEESMLELSLYVANYENMYGSGKFQYHSDKTPLQPVRLPGKKGSQTNNKSNLEDSVEQITTSDDQDQNLPHLNVSLLHDDVSDTKAGLQSSVRAAIDTDNSNVVCHMTFDEEGPGEMSSTSEVVIDEPAYIHLVTAVPQLSTQVSDESISESQFNSIPSSAQINVNEIASSSNNTNYASVIPCSSSPLVITSTHSLNGAASDTINDSEPTSTYNNSYRKIFQNMLNDSTLPDEMPNSGDDEIQVVSESNRRQSLVDSVFKSQPQVKTFCELLLSNKPSVRNFVTTFQNMALQLYLAMWLDVNTGKLDEGECKTFHTFCEKLFKTIESLKSQNRQLKSQVASLEERLAAGTVANSGKNSLRDQIIKAQARKNDEDVVKFKQEINQIFTDLNSAKKSARIWQESSSKYEEKTKTLNEKIKELLDIQEQMQERDQEYETKIRNLKTAGRHFQTQLGLAQGEIERLKAEIVELRKVKNPQDVNYGNADEDKDVIGAEESASSETDSTFVRHTEEIIEREHTKEVTTTEEMTITATVRPSVMQIPMNVNVPQIVSFAPTTSQQVLTPRQIMQLLSGSMEKREVSQHYESHTTVEHSSKLTSSQDHSKRSSRVNKKRGK